MLVVFSGCSGSASLDTDAAVDRADAGTLPTDASGDADTSHFDAASDTGTAWLDATTDALVPVDASLDASGPPCNPDTFVARCDGTLSITCVGGHELHARCGPFNRVCIRAGVCVASEGCDSTEVTACAGGGALAASCSCSASGCSLSYGYCPPDSTCQPTSAGSNRGECVSMIDCGGHAIGDKWCDANSVLRCQPDGAHRFPCSGGEACRVSAVLEAFASCEPPDAVACDPSAFTNRCSDPSTAEICDDRAGLVRTYSCSNGCCVDSPSYDGLNFCCPPS